ncbi:MAG: spermidine/putrescine ABC transporter substrate-binding protein [Fibrobacter sp.]|nr:spermidine/putrescine ABC transporter substrate-binding protein [Fibrobacter sp.]
MKKLVSSITVATILLATGLFCGCDQKSKQHPVTVNVLTYSKYIAPEMITDFQMKTGYKLQLEEYEAQEEMINKLQTAMEKQYDVVVASDVVIQQMIHLGLIAPLDLDKIPNKVNVADQFKNPVYDPGNNFTLPYLWGTTGILYRDTTLDVNSVSYNMLFDPKQIKGKFSLLNESRSMLSMALQAKGLNANSVKMEDINRAVEWIREIKRDPHFAGFEGSVSAKDKVISKENWAAIVFNGEAMNAIAEDSTLQYAIPTEGSFMWVDAMVLCSHAQNSDGAHAFMNYILDAKNGAKLATETNFASPNSAALKLIDEKFKQNRVINPTREEIDRMVFLRDPGAATKFFDDAWAVVKAH